jgi:SHS2 domain-containing protein
VQPSYEFFDHTADMGIRVRAAGMAELLMPAAEGLYAAIGELVAVGEGSLVHFDFQGDDPSVLLRDFLTELLILFERDQRRLVAVLDAPFTESRLMVTAKMSPVDLERSVFHREVKAITYHELSIRPIPGGYEATFIVDI